MNKKDAAELKKNFSDDSGFFTMNKVVSAFIDSEKRVICKQTRDYISIQSDEAAIIMATLKKVISGSLGKSLVEYRFPNEAYDEGGAQQVLWNAVSEKLSDESSDGYIQRIIENIDYAPPFALLTAHCTYTPFKKDINGDSLDEAEGLYNFIVSAICPVSMGDDGLIYDVDSNNIVKKINMDRIVSRVPSDGILYPVFSDGAPDVNCIMYFSYNSKKPNQSIICDVLQCEAAFTPQTGKETFQKVLSDVAGDELSYTVVTEVNERIEEFIAKRSDDAELPSIDEVSLSNILLDVGVSEERVATVHDIFTETVGDKPLVAANLVASKTVVATPDVTVTISKSASNKLRTGVFDGRKCLIIDLDDPNIVVNGLPMELK